MYYVSMYMCTSCTRYTFSLCRRTIGYEDVLDALAQKGISIRVASPKLVMEEV